MGRQKASIHEQAIWAVEFLEYALGEMPMATPPGLPGYSMLEIHLRGLEAIRASVLFHAELTERLKVAQEDARLQE